MHILLTDVLSCPRCGPDFGLIIMADRLDDRRILQGSFGCSNCRESYPVSGGLGDLRYPSERFVEAASNSNLSEDRAFRLTALMGVSEGPGNLLVIGPGAVHAPEITALVPDIEVIAADATVAGHDESAGVSRILHSSRLPFKNASMRGVAVTGAVDIGMLTEATRTLARGARIVVEESDETTRETITSLGLQLLLDQGGVLVASSPGQG